MDFDDTGKKTTRGKIRQFEITYGISLPDDYKSFLLKFNGGYPSDDLAFNIEEDGTDSVLSHFYELGKSTDEIQSLEECISDLVQTGFIPPNYLPIADDAFGNQICVGLSEEIFGQIFFWDHEGNDQTMVRVASNFQSFLEGLKKLD